MFTVVRKGSSQAAGLLLSAALVAGCSSSDGSSAPQPQDPPAEPPVVRLADPFSAPASASDMLGPDVGGLEGRYGWRVEYTVVVAPGVTSPSVSSPGWRLVPPAALEARAAALSGFFGLDAPVPSEWDEDSWSSSGPDGESLWVSASGDWYYSGPYGLWPVWDCPEVPSDLRPDGTGDAGATPVPDCMPPAPALGVPSAGEVRRLALDLLARFGHTDLAGVSVQTGEWGVDVQAETRLPDGGASGVMVGAGFGAEGRVTWASGSFAELELLGGYPLVTVEAAAERLQTELNGWGDLGVGYVLPEMGEDGADGAAPAWGEVSQVTLEVVEVSVAHMRVWAVDGQVVVLPHFRLVDSAGGFWFALAVEDRFLAF